MCNKMELQLKLINERRVVRNVFIKCVPPSIDSAAFPVLFHGLNLVLIDVCDEIKNELAVGTTTYADMR